MREFASDAIVVINKNNNKNNKLVIDKKKVMGKVQCHNKLVV